MREPGSRGSLLTRSPLSIVDASGKEQNHENDRRACRQSAGFEVYIGRKVPRSHHPQARIVSIWGNPYVIARDGTRAECVARYREYIMSRSDLPLRLPELHGKVLGCW